MKCEGCHEKRAYFGYLNEGRKRWCSRCAASHAGSVDIASPKCEDCHRKQPSFGFPAEVCSLANSNAQSHYSAKVLQLAVWRVPFRESGAGAVVALRLTRAR